MTAPAWTPCRVTLGQLKPWAANPRLSTKAQAKRILASFQKFGQVLPVAIGPDNEVYDGHQRLSALLTVHGPEYEIDARRSSRPLTDDERRALVVTLHAGAVGAWNWDDLAGWDAAALGEWGMDAQALKQWNTDAAALAAMLEAEKPTPVDAEPQIDRAEELRVKWGVEPGQLWRLGEHRLICGDCTDAGTVALLMQGEKAGAVVTDPPWNVGWEYDEYKDNLTREQYKEFCDKWRTLAEGIGASLFFVALSMKTYQNFAYWFPMAERIFAECQNFTQHTPGWMQSAYNPILIWGDSGKKSKAGQRDWFLAETSKTQMTADKELAKLNTATRWLPTVEYLVSFTDEDQVIYEPFSGTGTTILACQNQGRRCRAVEISPAYVAVALERWATATGGTPELVEA